jgi:lactoylglutathione lyase
VRRAALAVALLAAPVLAQTTAPPPRAGSLIGPALWVADKPRALHFYVDGLGMSLNMTMGAPARQESILGFSADPHQPGIILLCDTTATAPPAIDHGHGFDRVVLRMADLDATAARLKAAGFAPAPIRDVAMGYRMMLVTDPDGYKLELVQSAMRP